MDNEKYRQIISAADQISMELFFEWFEENPDFMEMSEIEIEVNFLLRSTADLAYVCGVVDMLQRLGESKHV